jgi:leader peptidase (prepilin peptidase)/N-methyltransferase
MLWSELIFHETDRLVMKYAELDLQGNHYTDTEVHFYYDRVVAGGGEHKLDTLAPFGGRVTEIVIPREAMGFGDVKFIAAIGAFLGWQSVFFTIASASMIGAIVGTVILLLNKRHLSSKIPFGPYLAVGALIWMFAGREIIHWYLNRMIGE